MCGIYVNRFMFRVYVLVLQDLSFGSDVKHATNCVLKLRRICSDVIIINIKAFIEMTRHSMNRFHFRNFPQENRIKKL